MNPPSAPLTPSSAESRVFGAELLISTILRVGVVTSLLFIVTGLVLLFIGHPEYMTSTEAFQDLTHPAEASPFSLAAILDGAVHARGESIITLGFLILAFTPVLRVAVSLAMFIYRRDRIFIAITLAVLLFLLSSFILGRAGR